MDEGAFAKCSCEHCEIHLEFPRAAAGAEIDCPQCHQKTTLMLPEDFDPNLTPAAEAKGSLSAVELLSSFGGAIQPPRVSLLYRAGLALVALTMILLPIVYLGM